MEAQRTEIRKEISKGKLTVSRVYKSDYQKEGTMTAEVKQLVTTKSYYPTKAVSSDLQDNPFSMAELGIEEQEFSSESTRVIWLDVPLDATVESVQAKIDALKGATIYSIVGNHPILSDRQKAGLIANLTTLDAIADSQVLRYGKENEKAGQLILDAKGKPQYRGHYFRASEKADEDHKTADTADFYASAKIKSEMSLSTNFVGVKEDGVM